uniref:Uncharacterized protein n=1 Tax=Medicago truncatula TaxID=3880 RepID=B7FJX4_MEDTR|nr:unknown [Medicago truncatula]
MQEERNCLSIKNKLGTSILPMLRRIWRDGRMQEMQGKETMFRIYKKQWTKNRILIGSSMVPRKEKSLTELIMKMMTMMWKI